ncbi:MAG TPA: hypothetical protein ENJ95_19045, partial [Bacteroidetes bacterium]|nr:hypothetical protein [Bacteroidota bacterium]
MNKLSLFRYVLLVLPISLLWPGKTDAQLALQWERIFKTPGNSVSTNFIKKVPAGGYIIGGAFTRITNAGTISSPAIIRVSEEGNVLWQQEFNNMASQGILDVSPVNDGGFVGVGYTKEQFSDREAWIIKLDAFGNLLWEKVYGGSFSEQLNSVVQTADGGYFCTGKTSSSDGDVNPTAGHSQYGAWVLKLDGNGVIVWNKKYGDAGITSECKGGIQTPDGGFVVSAEVDVYMLGGDVPASFGKNDFWAFKIDGTGNLLWTQVFGGSEDEFLNKTIELADGNFLLGGSTRSSESGTITQQAMAGDAWLVKIDGNGNLIWQKTYDAGSSLSMAETTLGNICLSSKKYRTTFGQDAVVTKLDMDGNFVEEQFFHVSDFDSPSDIVGTLDGQALVTGQTSLFIPPSSVLHLAWVFKAGENNPPLASDLELSLFADPFNPPAFTKAPVKATLVNKGNLMATGIKVHFPKPPLAVYFGGDEFTASQGTFDHQGNEEWLVGSLAPGDTATLLVNYFPLAAEMLKPFAQVTAANEPDFDSAANNGFLENEYHEDDESAVVINVSNAGGELYFTNSDDIIENAFGESLVKQVNYNRFPYSSCVNGGVLLRPLTPIPDGNHFPIGTTPVCLEATDDCGNRDTVCFNVIITTSVTSPSFSHTFYDIFQLEASAPFTNLGKVENDSSIRAGNMVEIADHRAFGIFPGPPQSFDVLVKVYLSTNQYSNQDGLLLLTAPVTASSPAPDHAGLISEGSLGQVTIPANTPPGQYFLKLFYDADNTVPELNDLNRFAYRINIAPPLFPPAIDLSLDLVPVASAPTMGAAFSVTATVQNGGPETATGIKVHLPKPTNLIYETGNEYSLSNGTFDFSGSEEWAIDSLPKDSLATMTLNFFLSGNAYPDFYGQVIAANEADEDSTPGNGTGPIANEDDEAHILYDQLFFPDFSIAGVTMPAQLDAGATTAVHFQFANGGDTSAIGPFKIKMYLSDDAFLDIDDLELANINRLHLATGTFSDSADIRLPFIITPGNYFLLTKIDADGQIAESDETNNQFLSAFEITVPAVCTTNSFNLTSQAEVNQFPGCPVIDGNLSISGSDIVDLSPLSVVTTVTGSLDIYNTSLTNLNAFQNLTALTNLSLYQNSLLSSISGLSGLSGALGNLLIENNDSLLNLAGLEGVTSVNNLMLYYNDNLQSLTGLENLEQINGSFWALLLPSLTDITAFSNLKNIGDEFHLVQTTALANLNGLGQLTSIGNRLYLEQTDALTDLTGLENIQFIGKIEISDNASLASLQGLNPQVSINDLVVHFNPNLSDCCSLFNLLDNGLVSGAINISGNAFGCQSSTEILTGCLLTPCVGDIVVSSQAELNGIAGCTTISGSLTINGTDIVDLSPLLSLTQITGELSIGGCPSLASLTGLDNLQSVSGISVFSNQNLTSLAALGNVVSNNVFPLLIFNNSQLTSLTGLEGITGASSFNVANNNSLLSLEGLQNLERVNFNASIKNNPLLIDLDELSSLTYVQHELRISDNLQLQNVDSLLSLNFAQTLRITDNPQLALCCGLSPILNNGGVMFTITFSGNLPDCNSQQQIASACTPIDEKIDLELSLDNPAAAVPYTSYPVVATLVNQGNSDATGVKVHFPKPDGVVYTGGNEYSASQGTFNTLSTEIWNVGTVPAGGSASLTVNYYLLQNDLPLAYAQVTKADQFDVDSTPNNGMPPSVNEDDEASTAAPVLLPDWVLTDLTIPNPSLALGEDLQYTYYMDNLGKDTFIGDITIQAWFSNDNILSPEDIQGGSNSLNLAPVGNNLPFSISGVSSTASASLGTGDYFLILHIDSFDDFAESNENNNDIALPFMIAENTCTGNTTLSSQAEVDAFPNCPIVSGDLVISGADIYDLTPLSILTEVTNALVIQNNPNLASLTGLENLTTADIFVLFDNPLLTNLQPLANFNNPNLTLLRVERNNSLTSIAELGPINSVVQLEVVNNSQLLNLIGLENLTTVSSSFLLQDNNSLINIDELSSLTSVGNSFLLTNNDGLEDINGLSQLTSAGGQFVIAFDNQLTNLNGLENLHSAEDFIIQDNAVLENIDALTSFNTTQKLAIHNNPSLPACCGIYDILNNGSISGFINIQNNLPGCNSQQEILDTCAPVGGSNIDLELSMAGPSSAPIYTSYPIDLSITNAGDIAATGVKVHFPHPSGVVYTGGNEFTASQGSFAPLNGEEWNVGTLPAGASATLRVNYFLLQNNLPEAYAQVTAANETDVDSTPNNGTPPSVNEDDEASTAGGSPALPDLVLANLNILNAPIGAGETLNYSFDISNLGSGAASGNFNVKAWISTDNLLSPDDIQDGTVQTGNYAPGLTQTGIPGASTIPSGLADGNYFLIVKVDADDVISESNEDNNIVFQNFSVTSPQIICIGDVFLESQAEVNAFSNCTTIDGSLVIRSPFGAGGASSDITDLSPLLSLTEVTGGISIVNNDQLLSLHGLDNVTAYKRLAIVD